MLCRLMLQSEFDRLIEVYGIKYVFIESGDIHIEQKCEEAGISYDPSYKYWCELSWGSSKDEFDFAFNDFGSTVTEAINKCLTMFMEAVRKNEFSDQAVIARQKNIYQEILNG